MRLFQINNSPQVYVAKCKMNDVKDGRQKNCDHDVRSSRGKAGQAGKHAAEQISERPAGRKREVAGCNESRQLEC